MTYCPDELSYSKTMTYWLMVIIVVQALYIGVTSGDAPPAIVVIPASATAVGLPYDQYHDQAAQFSPPIMGVVSLGIATSRADWPPAVGSEGDMAVMRIDRLTGRLLAKCD